MWAVHQSNFISSVSFFLFSLSLPLSFYLHQLSNCPWVLFPDVVCSVHPFILKQVVSKAFSCQSMFSKKPLPSSYYVHFCLLAFHLYVSRSVHFPALCIFFFVTVISENILKTDNKVITVMCEFSGWILKVLKVQKWIVWNELEADYCSWKESF